MCENLGIILAIIGLFIALAYPLLLFFIKPKLKIDNLCLVNKNQLSVEIINKGCVHAVNLKIEIAIIDCGGSTYHLKVDMEGFIMIPPAKKGDNTRKFKSSKFSAATKQYFNNQIPTIEDWVRLHKIVRVRVHSEQGFTGFGKAIEQKFEYCNNLFVKSK